MEGGTGLACVRPRFRGGRLFGARPCERTAASSATAAVTWEGQDLQDSEWALTQWHRSLKIPLPLNCCGTTKMYGPKAAVFDRRLAPAATHPR